MNKVLIVIFMFIGFVSYSQDSYFAKHQHIADSLENVYGIPSSLMLAVAYHESAGGKSAVAKHSNNHFGIKGKNHKVNSKYRYYESTIDSYVGFCKLVTGRKFYSTLKNTTDVKKWVINLSKTGYAANSTTWSQKIMGIIKKNNLN